MTHTYSKIYYHLVWSTKERRTLIHSSFEGQVYQYMHGVANKMGCQILNINGTSDHIHILVSTPPTIEVPALVKAIKTGSTSWIQRLEERPPWYGWQQGYSVFTVGHSQLETVYGYIAKQKEHHKTVSFEEEYLGLLHILNIEYDKRFVLG